MKISFFAILVAGVFAALPAWAQTDGERSFLCNRSATYTPAVTVNGKEVTRADVNANDPNVILLPPTVQIPVTIDMAQWLGLKLPDGTRMESVMGFAEVAKDGTVTWNGQDITANVAAACSKITVDGQ